MKQTFNQPVKQWMRSVSTNQQGWAEIKGRQIYILPTKYGFLFGILLILMLIGSVNYANNPAFLVTFLLTGLYINTLFLTWHNLRGLSIRWTQSHPAFADEDAEFFFEASQWNNREHHGIHLALSNNQPCVFNTALNDSTFISALFKSRNRGRLKPKKITIASRYPLGLFHAWAYLDISAEAIIYPKPSTYTASHLNQTESISDSGDKGIGHDDFVGHRDFFNGDNPRHINWKYVASGKGVYIKQFGGQLPNHVWLDIDALEEGSLETKLSQLSASIIELENEQTLYGLRLDSLEIDPAIGYKHKHHCLKSLALYLKPAST